MDTVFLLLAAVGVIAILRWATRPRQPHVDIVIDDRDGRRR